jgi:hypothetical protein
LLPTLIAAIALTARAAEAGCPKPEPVAPDPAESERLFTEAKQLQKEGRLAEACQHFERSRARNPAAGGMLLRLAYCLELEGKLASSHARFVEALEAAERDGKVGRADQARQHLAALAPRLSWIEIRVSAAARGRAGLEILRDGECVDAGAWDTAVPADPGQHRVSATAPGAQPWEIRVEVQKEGATTVVEVPSLLPLPKAIPAPAEVPREASRPRRGSLVPGIVVTSAGAAGLVVGAVTGALALADAGALKSACLKDVCAPSSQVQRDRAVNLGTVAGVGLIYGGALAVAGVVLLVVHPLGKAKAAGFAAGPGSLTLWARFR